MSSTPKKYLSLDEAAQQLAVSTDELMRMRENGEIRGFADRGTWKFRVEDVEELGRTRQADSSPEVQLFDDSGPMVIGGADDEGGSSTILADDVSGFAADADDQPTEIHKSLEPAESPLGHDSDSDVTITGPEGSDSDVRLVGADSDSDVTLAPADAAGSDSDVKLIDSSKDSGSDSDVALIGGADSSIALDLSADEDDQASVLMDDEGLSMDSSLTLAADSGISLEADEGITLDTGADSGISLESIGDSGISLEDSGEISGTVPMMDVMGVDDGVEETKFEIPSMADDSAFDLEMEDSGDETGVLDLADSGDATLDDAVFDIDDDESFDEVDELEVADEILGEDDELDDLDVFDADEGLFEESGVSQEFAAPVAGRMVVESEWSGMVVASLSAATVLMLLATIVSFDLARSMWQWDSPTPVSSLLLGLFGGQ